MSEPTKEESDAALAEEMRRHTETARRLDDAIAALEDASRVRDRLAAFVRELALRPLDDIAWRDDAERELAKLDAERELDSRWRENGFGGDRGKVRRRRRGRTVVHVRPEVRGVVLSADKFATMIALLVEARSQLAPENLGSILRQGGPTAETIELRAAIKACIAGAFRP